MLVNTSPEPFSNAAVSVAEDAVVLGGLALIAHHPVLSFIVFVLLLMFCMWVIKKNLWLNKEALE